MGNSDSAISKSIEASADVSKAIINGETEKYKARMLHMDNTQKEETAKMSALFMLVEKTNTGTLDAIKELNKSISSVIEVTLKANETALKEYQTTLRSLGNNIADQTKNFAAIVESAKGLDKDVQKDVIIVGKEVMLEVKTTLSECFKMITGLAAKHDERFSKICEVAVNKLNITEKVLDKLLENEEAFTSRTIEMMERHREVF